MPDSEAASLLDPLMRPRSLAFVGVSASGGTGARMLKSAKEMEFDGPIWPIHPTAVDIGGLPAFASMADLPGVPDCLVVAVPSPAVASLLEQAGQRGVRAAIVVSEGFADAGSEEGRARESELAGIAAKHGMAVAGPNCMGIASLAHRFAASFNAIPHKTIGGGVSLISQSGGLLNAAVEFAANRGFGLNYLVSIGNQAVVELADYIDFLAQDSATKVIALIMEGAKDARRFRAAVERAARVKPLVVLKLGRSERGQAATLAHTGTLAGRFEAYAALFKQTGVAMVSSIDELMETAALFSLSPLPAGDGICMLTVSGGATSLIGDLGTDAGLRFPALQPQTNTALQRILGVSRDFGNPVDSVGMPRLRKHENMTAVLNALLADDGIDVVGLVIGLRLEGADSHQELLDQLSRACAAARKPVVVISFISNSLTEHWRTFASTRRLPVLEDVGRGLKAVRRLVDYAARRRAAPAQSTLPPPLMHNLAAGRTLTESESKTILGQASLPVTKEFLARTPKEAGRLFGDIGGKVALKIQSPDVPHKSDVGGVALGVASASETETAAERILENVRQNCPDAAVDGVLVQEMVDDAAEFLLGMTYDEQFGPMIVCGAGGLTVEVFKDASVRLPPLDAAEARSMLAELKAARLLSGFRGAPPRDVDAFVDCIVRFSRFVTASDGEFDAIDLNPVFVLAEGKGVKIGDALMLTRATRGSVRHA